MRSRSRLSVILLVASLSMGCSAFQPERYELNKAEVAALRAEFGNDMEAMRAQLAKDWGVQVDELSAAGKRMEATIAPLAEELGVIAAQGASKTVTSGASPWSIVLGILGTLGLGTGAVLSRKKVRETHKRVKTKGEDA